MININIQGLPLKINQLQTILQNRATTDILTITEHWMKEAEVKTLNFADYNLAAYACRETFSRGGVLILTKHLFKAEPVDLSNYIEEKCLEMCAVSIKCLNAIIVAVYHPPDANNEIFFTGLRLALNEITNIYPTRNIFVLGDYNICTNENTTLTDDFCALMAEYGLYPSIWNKMRGQHLCK